MDLQTLTIDRFSPHVGRPVTLQAAAGTRLEATLDQCRSAPRSTPPDALRQAFSLVLALPAGAATNFESGLFKVSVESLGAFGPVYVERVLSSRPDRALLEIIFN